MLNIIRRITRLRDQTVRSKHGLAFIHDNHRFDEKITQILRVINTAKHEAIKFTPFYLLFCRTHSSGLQYGIIIGNPNFVSPVNRTEIDEMVRERIRTTRKVKENSAKAKRAQMSRG